MPIWRLCISYTIYHMEKS